MVLKDRQQKTLERFAGLYRAKTLNEGEQIIFGMEGIVKEKYAYAVMNKINDCQTLTLCINRTALVDYALLILSRQQKEDPLRIAGQMLQLNCLQCHAGMFSEQPLQGYMTPFEHMKNAPSGEVIMRRCRAGFLPDSNLSEQQRHMLLAAVETVCEYFEEGNTVQQASSLLKQEGKVFCAKWSDSADILIEWDTASLDEQAQIEYPSPVLEDEAQVRRIKRCPYSGASLSCALRYLPIPVSENPVRTPVMLAMIDDINGVVGTPIVEDYEKDCLDLASAFMSYMEEAGRPERILVSDERTYGLLGGIAQQVNVKIERARRLAQVDELIQAYMDMACGGTLSEKQDETQSVQQHDTVNGNGICMICAQEMSAQQMREHITECVKNAQHGHGEDNLILHIADRDDADYWMEAAVKKDATLMQLDQFLRDVWLDSEHNSMAVCGGTEYYCADAAAFGGRSMNVRIFKHMAVGTQMLYEYDFEHTTRLVIDVLGEFKAEKRHKKAIQIARNIQPKYACVKCGRKAEFTAARDGEPIAQKAYCTECGGMDEGIKDTLLPILNSPRCGMNGYGAWMKDIR